MQTNKVKFCYNNLCKQFLLPGCLGKGLLNSMRKGALNCPLNAKYLKKGGCEHARYSVDEN